MNQSIARICETGTLPVAVAMLPGKRDRAAVAAATDGLVHLEFCEHAPEAEDLVMERGAVALFTRHTDSRGNSTEELIERVRCGLPHLPIIVVESTVPTGEEPFDASETGASAVLRVRHKRFRPRVEELIRRELHRARRGEMADQLARLVPYPVRLAVRCAIEHGDRRRAIDDLAASMGIARKALDRRLRVAAAPSAEQLIGWGRLLAAAMCFEDPAMSVNAVACELAFPSTCSLRNLLRRYVGIKPSQLRHNGGANYLLGRMRAALLRGRTIEENAG